jgi:hypothetical protein
VSVPLETPRSAEDLYIARGLEVSILRPIITGDVFMDVDIPGVEKVDGDDDRLAVIVSHPCSMRDGYVIKPAVQAIRVVRAPVVELSDWKRHYDRMPLPNLCGQSNDDAVLEPDDSYAAIFDLRGRVRSNAFALEKRRACLSEEGVGFLHQRMGHADNRYAPAVDDLVVACASPFAETELAEDWNSTIPDIESVDAALRDKKLLDAAKEFDDVLSELREAPSAIPGRKPTKYRLRDDLGSIRKRAAARREILKMINERRIA